MRLLELEHEIIGFADGKVFRAVLLPLDAPPSKVLGPTSTVQHVYTVCVLDDTGAPVAGAKLTVVIAGDEQDKTTDGSGKVTITKTVTDTASPSNPAPENAPTAAEHHSVAAVFRPRIVAPSFRMTPAPSPDP